MRTALVIVATIGLLAVACSDDDGGSGSGPPEIQNVIDSYRTPGGVLVTEVAAGSEENPVQPGDTIQMHYTGWLADGTVFDSSYERGTPFTFTLGNREVIQGWEEGVDGMSPGDERRLVIPSDLGYGPQGRGEIPPNAELTFDIELIAFIRPSPTQPAPDVTENEASFRTEGGVLVVVVQEGAEDNPAAPGDTLQVQYTGWLEDGTQFDTSRDRGPFEVTLGAGGVIPGWEEGLEGMSPGEIRHLVIPPELAYGEGGFGEIIPPNAELTFEVELTSLEHQTPTG